jgi:hypothetical protein
LKILDPDFVEIDDAAIAAYFFKENYLFLFHLLPKMVVVH